ncbi:MAG: oligosaccharide flippase family protein, partial [Planctomycetes bacterium]|nr:oligosaccharide flippase family protein [Planctomycetota bacterium]
NKVSQFLLAFTLCPWKLALSFSRTYLREMWKSGRKLWAASIFTGLCERSDQLLLGALLSEQALGLYARAQGFLQRLAEKAVGFTSGPTLSGYVNLKDDEERRDHFFRQLNHAFSYLVTICMGLLYLGAEALVLILCGEEWLGAAVMLRALLVFAVFRTLGNNLLAYLTYRGQPEYSRNAQALRLA